jgi:hypothetical protein
MMLMWPDDLGSTSAYQAVLTEHSLGGPFPSHPNGWSARSHPIQFVEDTACFIEPTFSIVGHILNRMDMAQTATTNAGSTPGGAFSPGGRVALHRPVSPSSMETNRAGRTLTMTSETEPPPLPGINQDSFLARLLSLHALPPADQLNWICAARSAAMQSLELLSVMAATSIYEEAANRAAAELLETRLTTLDALYQRLIKHKA